MTQVKGLTRIKLEWNEVRKLALKSGPTVTAPGNFLSSLDPFLDDQNEIDLRRRAVLASDAMPSRAQVHGMVAPSQA